MERYGELHSVGFNGPLWGVILTALKGFDIKKNKF